jgi:hypothetical protein
MRNSAVDVTTLILLYLFLLLGCDEALPPYENPKALLGELTFQYVFKPDENDFRFYVAVRNIYDETFQDSVSVKGTLEVILKRDQRFRKTFKISMSNYYTPVAYLDSIDSGTYDINTNMFTIDPGKKVEFLCQWNFIDDSSRDIRTYVFSYMIDPLCAQRLKSNTETFILKGPLYITNHSGEIMLGPREVETFYVTPYVVGKTCPSY